MTTKRNQSATVRTRATLAKVAARLDVGAVDPGDWKFIRDALSEAAGIADREASRLFAKSKTDLAKIEARAARRA